MTDLYEMTMMQGYFKTQNREVVVFDAFYRTNPCEGGYAICAGLEQVNQRTHERRTAGNDTCEQDDRNAVADTLLGDMLAHPHNQRGACGESYDNGYGCKRAGVGQHSLAAETVAEQCVV